MNIRLNNKYVYISAPYTFNQKEHAEILLHVNNLMTFILKHNEGTIPLSVTSYKYSIYSHNKSLNKSIGFWSNVSKGLIDKCTDVYVLQFPNFNINDDLYKSELEYIHASGANIYTYKPDDLLHNSITKDASYNTLNKNDIFVFGSNEMGVHGAGAALHAKNNFGAVQYVGYGLRGNSFAIPTKDQTIHTLSLSRVEEHVNNFKAFVKLNPQYNYKVTKIGCGLAGFSIKDIAPMFESLLEHDNVELPLSFINYYKYYNFLTS